jgi:hypothetical protein
MWKIAYRGSTIAAPTPRAYAAYAALQNTHMISLCSISCSCILSKFDLKKIRCSFMGNIEVAINYCIQRCDQVCPVLQWSCTLLLVVSEPNSKKGDHLPWCSGFSSNHYWAFQTHISKMRWNQCIQFIDVYCMGMVHHITHYPNIKSVINSIP